LEFRDDEVGIQYKYVICTADGQAERWEERDNRVLIRSVFKPLSTLVISDTFNVTDNQSISYCCLSLPSFEDSLHDVHNDVPKSTGMGSSDEDTVMPSSDGDCFSPTRRDSKSYLAEDLQEDSIPEPMALEREKTVDEGQAEESAIAEGCIVREESLSHFHLSQHNCTAPEFEQRYRLESQSPLAQGTFGLVWVCSERACCDKVLRAVKIVHKSRLRPRELHLLLSEEGEIQTHLRLKHKHIVALYEAFDDLRTVSLIMEYGRGGDLFDAITTRRRTTGLGLLEVDASVAQRHILLALAYLDSQSIVHRDMKCENALLVHEKVPIHENVLKLCDFGFATFDDGNGLTDRLGSPDTVAPEVIKGIPYGTKADVWSAGVMLFMMLSAKSPFWAPTDAQVLARIRVADWSMTGVSWNDVSESAKACVGAMMTADPTLRPSAQ